ncbi:MAG: hypothetical protein IT262_02615 [Saprospiraceae bacterium]|nr:hypothetical protein [Saprospiraceae bacterium]
MPVLVKKSFAWIWMAALLTATMGVSVHQIYCYCADKGSVSIFSIEDECSAQASDEAAKPSCCAKKAPTRPSCCEKSGAEGTNKRHGCTEKTTKVFQLKPEFILSESDFGKIIHCPSDLPPAPVFIFHGAGETTSQLVGIQSFPNPPPPLSGRMICVRHCVARC